MSTLAAPTTELTMSDIEIRHERDLVKVAPKDAGAYQDIPLTSLTSYSLYWLHQWQLRRSIEAIAVLNWRLFPTKFAMVGFPEYPDAFRTNRSLLQGQPKYRNLLTGAASKGFSLNERGMNIARDLIEVLGVPSATSGETLGDVPRSEAVSKSSAQPRSLEPAREVERLRSSKLYEKWKGGVMVGRDLIHVHALLGIFDHTPTKVRIKAMRDIEQYAKDVEDEEALKFLEDVRQTFPQVFISKAE
jgi:hypothetical protein